MKDNFFSLFALFFPSWNFFGGSDSTPYLFVQVGEEHWPVFPPAKVNLAHLFFNPHGNLYLAHHSHMQALHNEIFTNQDNPQFNLEKSPIYHLAKNWAEHYLIHNKIVTDTYQLKFSYVKKVLNNIEIIEEIFQSPTYEFRRIN